MKKSLFFLIFFCTQFFFAQQIAKVDFKTSKANIAINHQEKVVKGTISYMFSVIKSTDSIFIDARQMEFDDVKLNGKSVKFYNDKSKLWLLSNFKAGIDYSVEIVYSVKPKKALYFIGWEFPDAKKQVWTQGQGKYTSHWLPSFDDMNEKVVYDLTISFSKDYSVIANGKLVNVNEVDGQNTWQYDMKEPMSSYLLAFAIGMYDKKVVSSRSGIPIELYFYPEDTSKIEPTYRYSKEVFDFLEDEIGVPYPWQNYKQIPVKDFLYAGMENTTTTIFSDSYIIDSIAFNDKNYVNVNAHELAHQWFGDLVTEESGKHHWLQEGFATYYALLAEKEVFGDDYFYWKLYRTYEQLMVLSKQGKGESLLDPTASSLTFYEKGAWALHVLRAKIGDDHFKEAIKIYLNKYKFKNVNTINFISIVEQVSGKKMTEFVKLWLEQKEFPEDAALKALSASGFIKNFLLLKKNRLKVHQNTISLSVSSFSKLISEEETYFPLKTELIYQLKKVPKDLSLNYYKSAFKSNNLKVRQAIATTLDTIPQALKENFESLLKDDSYITVENALFKLWLNFPKDRNQYLDQTSTIYGFNDKNIRLLWLTLALATPGYDSKNTPLYYNELSSYTTPSYHFETRQSAFRFLYQLQAFTNQNLKDLLEACRHPVWQFSKSSKQLLDRLLNESLYRQRYEQFFSELSPENQVFLKKQLNKSN